MRSNLPKEVVLLLSCLLIFPLQTLGQSAKRSENFSLTNVFRALAKDDLYRAVDIAKSFKYDAPRATVTLAIASSLLKGDLRDLQD